MGSTAAKILRVSLVTETYPPEINGVANTLRQLAEGLRRRGHGVHLIRPRRKGERSAEGHGDRVTPEQSPGGLSHYPSPLSAGGGGPVMRGPDGEWSETPVPGLPILGYRNLRFGLPVYRRLRRMWHHAPPDIVYIATQGPLGHAALEAARADGIPTLTGFHTRFHTYSRHYGLGILERRIVTVLRRFHNRAGATLVPTERLRAELMNLGFRNVHVLSRGVDTGLFHPKRCREDLRRGWGCRSGERIVLYVGRLAAEKNLELVLQAFDVIISKSPDAKLVLVGDGPELERLRQTYPNVILTGAKVGVELAEHYASGDLFLFPSLTETFGNVVPEAMASGLAVIAFDYGAAGTCIRSWENGVTVPLGDTDAFRGAAGRVACDDAQLHSLGEGARVTAEGMSWDRVIGDLEARLVEVIDCHRTEHRHETLAATVE